MIWILWHSRIGDLKQMEVLATSLGLPFLVKKLEFKWPHYPPLARLSSSSNALTEAWPDLILCTEALSSKIAVRLKKKSGGTIKIVSLARPHGDARRFDLVLTTAQYRLPNLPHVVELLLPLTAPNTKSTRRVARKLTVLVGASSSPESLDQDTAVAMVEALTSYADRHALELNVVTSPRTESEIARVFEQNMKAPHQSFIWKAGIENYYQGCLDEAAEIVVTSDSASMLSDALATGKPVWVYRLPRKFAVVQSLIEWIFKRAPALWIFRKGLIEPATDRWLLIERLVEKGYVQWFGTPKTQTKIFEPQVDIEVAVGALRKLLTTNDP